MLKYQKLVKRRLVESEKKNNISKIQQWRIYQTVSLCLICEQVNILNQENGFFQEGLKVGGPKGKRPFISTEIYCII